jgi:transcriptional regulator with XRE-family HTH domain
MLIGKKLKQLRESKNLSQGDIENRSGLIRAYTSRVENGHIVPSVETLEKYAGALDIPLYRMFYDGAEPPKDTIRFPADTGTTEIKEMVPLAKALSRLDNRDRILLLAMANQMARKHSRKGHKAQE